MPGTARPPATLVGDDVMVPCADGTTRRYVNLDSAASTSALPVVLEAVDRFVPHYSSVHRGTGYKSRQATDAFEQARAAVLAFAGGSTIDDVAIICRNTTEAINHLAYRLDFDHDDIVLTTVVEHHANLLPWGRVATRRYVECDADGTFDLDAVLAGLRAKPVPKLLAITGASNVTGWLPPIDGIIEAAHQSGVPVALDAAQLAPHRPIPAGADFVALSGHKMYAPFGAGALIGPRRVFEDGDPFLAGGGAVDLVDLDEVIWTDPPEREEAGSPNVVGAIALHAAIDELGTIGWDAIRSHEDRLQGRLRKGLAAIDGVTVLGPSPDTSTLATAAFTVEGVHHALVAARLSAEWGIGVRHGCFCAHPYIIRLLGLGRDDVDEYRTSLSRGDHSTMPGAVRASCGLSTGEDDVDTLLDAVRQVASGAPGPFTYEQDRRTGDYWPTTEVQGWSSTNRPSGPSCAVG